MADTAYLRYSNRVVTNRPGGRYDLAEIWIVPNIQNIWGGDTQSDATWQHEALSAADLPQIGDQMQDGGYICVSRTARSLDSQGMAYVDVRWVEDPLTLPTEVHYFAMSKQKPAWRGVGIEYESGSSPSSPPESTADLKDIRNSAGDRYNPPVTYEAAMERIEIIFRCSLELHDQKIDWQQYVKHWNKTSFLVEQIDPDNPDNGTLRIFSAGTLMFADKRAVLVKEPYFHRLVTCTFLCDPDMWCHRLPDMGPRCLKHLAPDGEGGVTTKPWTTDEHGLGTVTDAMGRPFSGPAELDGSGGQLVPDSEGKMPPAKMYQWWPVNEEEELLSAEFDDLDLFTPERTLDV